MNADQLRAALARLGPDARDQLRRLLIRDQANRDEIAQQALRRRALNLADIIDMLSIDADLRKEAVRLLAELEAQDSAR